MSKDQYNAIIALLQPTKDSSTSVNHIQHSMVNQSGIVSSLWILDSGAKDHICPDKSSFSFLKKIKPIHVWLPNNSYATASFAGDIQLGDLLLKNVLYVPYFSVHLVSISKLLSTIDCLVIFCKSICLIVQTSNFKIIGVAKQHHGLFHLQDFSDLNSFSFSKDSIVNATNSSMLWHFRLGHTSNKVLHQLCSQYNEISFDSFHPCDNCHYAKQKKLPFSNQYHC